jgi:hypothetical protein
MLRKKVLFVLLVLVAVVFLVSCNPISPETRAEVLTQQNCLSGCIDRCPRIWHATKHVQQIAATSAKLWDSNSKAGRSRTYYPKSTLIGEAPKRSFIGQGIFLSLGRSLSTGSLERA